MPLSLALRSLRTLRASVSLPLRLRPLPSRALSTAGPRMRDFNRPGPPALPAAEQAEFERLQKAAEVAVPAGLEDASPEELLKAVDELSHRDLRRGAAPLFEGDTNPQTGEVGGPKRDPFQATSEDWAFGGRVTDF
ncbi:hypothetical protein CC85DRAFT_269760 [Cutaneotrichosporon oleaginosum]|uniref:Succinate dehydrogenase assembly factor 4, mitochondrial n=1 Tax=Cutaneotrichosporon oleaginosum TaxID=879819 RepID=A0A0J0XW68_9TREE|nr:uncharacterized protein CC85DRAFT_269760 [Cutaneotrichosporon oleaginosum]KLT45288.1 hypothetical protein CC85DRAFT_269760 [Cutaneotrichosporon oleaginosum]